MIKKPLLILAVFTASTLLFNAFNETGVSTVIANQLAINNVNGKDAEFVIQHSYQNLMSPNLYATILTVAFSVFLLLRSKIKSTTIITAIAVSLSMLSLPSCKPYQKPVYKEIGSNETAFVIPLEGDISNQAKFDSTEALEKHKVATKRIMIPTRWNQTGRASGMGEYIPTVSIIVVDRSPITRNWEPQENGKSKDTAIWVESSDSVGFSMGFNCTAFIKEADTATFLYWYSSGSLSNVMDSEIRGRIQQIAAEESAKYPLDELRNRKNDIAASVREDIIPFFKERGITITTVGMFGGMTYENPSIQTSIDNVFVAQQEKNVALAKYDAQKKENERIILAAEGKAKEKIISATAEAEQREISATAEANAITMLTKAISEGGQSYLDYKEIEISIKNAERWDGALPQITGGAVPLMNADKILKD